MTTLKQIAHLGFDLALISIILAGLRRNTGWILSYEQSDLKNYIKRYLDWGEFLYGRLIHVAERSKYFRKETPLDGFLDGVFKRVEELGREPRKSVNRERATSIERR
ncbi:LANO_0F17194g1_1 [Lachancea nothofagi CBS 11611]|uniref:LANO_0F17194g1_1 n=1 Tax=Lachancea nothofagi CBS 11611 TaxID=1266666 RepID=A0A1G4KD88_9SACH|nr:LANO_0F17194g1_1 [Lachancea nothofagi CBS 11611]